jgi:outer membrane lipoprotein-sorting protein
MSDRRNETSEELLNRAVAATRQLPVPSGPSAAIVSQTSAALREAAHRPKTTLMQRIYHMPWTFKASAMLGIAASVLVSYVVLSNSVGISQAFADVAEALNNVHSATWKTTSVVKGPQNQSFTWIGIGMFLAPSHERTETTIASGVKVIQIVDGQKDKTLTLDPDKKTATVINLKNLPPENPFGKTFQGLRELVAGAQNGRAGKVERLDGETIDGRRAQGFRIRLGEIEVKIWADPKTLLPVRVEETTSASPEARLFTIVMTDFQIGMDLDESLFSLDVPVGYTVGQATQIDLSKKPIAYLAETLKMAAEYNDGVFPPTLRGDEGIDGIVQRAAAKLGEQHSKDSPEMLKQVTDLAMKLGGTFGFLFSLSPDANDWHYAGKDVKLNTPNRPIFWYKPYKSSPSYQVLYADLSIKEVPSEEAPKVPKSEGSPKP